MKNSIRKKTVVSLLILILSAIGFAQQTKGMAEPEEQKQVTIRLQDGEITINRNVAELSGTFKHFLEDMGEEEAIPLTLTQAQWNIVQPLLELAYEKNKEQLEENIQQLDLNTLVDLLINVNALDIEPVLQATAKVLAQRIQADLNLAFNPELQELSPELQDLVAKKLLPKEKFVLERILKGHTKPIFSVSWSPNGQQVASGSSDGTVRIWNIADGELIHQLREPSNAAIMSIDWSPDSKQIAGGSYDGNINIWNAANGTLVGTLRGEMGTAYSVSWSPNSLQIAAGYYGGKIGIWNVADNTLIDTLKEHTKEINSVAWSPDGQQIASGSSNDTIDIWNVADKTLIRTLRGHTNHVYTVAWSPNGQLIASGSGDSTLRIWIVENGELSHMLTGQATITHVAWSPNGQQVVFGSVNGTLRIWNIENGQLIDLQKEHKKNQIIPVAWSPNGKLIASGFQNNAVYLWKALIPPGYYTLDQAAVIMKKLQGQQLEKALQVENKTINEPAIYDSLSPATKKWIEKMLQQQEQ